jgi:hypothetical protein
MAELNISMNKMRNWIDILVKINISIKKPCLPGDVIKKVLIIRWNGPPGFPCKVGFIIRLLGRKIQDAPGTY